MLDVFGSRQVINKKICKSLAISENEKTVKSV